MINKILLIFLISVLYICIKIIYALYKKREFENDMRLLQLEKRIGLMEMKK